MYKKSARRAGNYSYVPSLDEEGACPAPVFSKLGLGAGVVGPARRAVSVGIASFSSRLLLTKY